MCHRCRSRSNPPSLSSISFRSVIDIDLVQIRHRYHRSRLDLPSISSISFTSVIGIIDLVQLRHRYHCSRSDL
ncbi:hypothetical protein QVD17_34216 [Tagetes erecta]|uniref:Uncharacterized protein n=1 Tax=Tagetes erecta TaxID=13708 RepID=A0AAD8K429_TARER|nr:hypothetical protein QVD17_34216 [Tagetes erecta]